VHMLLLLLGWGFSNEEGPGDLVKFYQPFRRYRFEDHLEWGAAGAGKCAEIMSKQSSLVRPRLLTLSLMVSRFPGHM
jgi:hypothetical protein